MIKLPPEIEVNVTAIVEAMPSISRRRAVNNAYATAARLDLEAWAKPPQVLLRDDTRTVLTELGRATYRVPPAEWVRLVAKAEALLSDGWTVTQVAGLVRRYWSSSKPPSQSTT